jgi:hypothetical protein
MLEGEGLKFVGLERIGVNASLEVCAHLVEYSGEERTLRLGLKTFLSSPAE